MPDTGPHHFDLLVFDWDGTLFDSTALIVRCMQDACRDLGCTVPDDRTSAHVIGLSLVDAFERVVPDLPAARYPELAERYRHYYFAKQVEVPLFPGVAELLHALKARGFRLAIATGKKRRGLDMALDSVRLHDVFDASRTADETAGKPDPLMLNELMHEFDVPQRRTLMIGDTTHDLQMAHNAGTASVAVTYGAHQPETLATFGLPQGTLAHVGSVAALSAWLASHG